MSHSLQIVPVNKSEVHILRRVGHRTFAELDHADKPMGYFTEIHESSTGDVPGKPIIKRTRLNPTVKANAVLRSYPRKKRVVIQVEGSILDQVAKGSHGILSRKTSVTRGELIFQLVEDLEISIERVKPAVSALIHKYHHLRPVDEPQGSTQ